MDTDTDFVNPITKIDINTFLNDEIDDLYKDDDRTNYIKSNENKSLGYYYFRKDIVSFIHRHYPIIITKIIELFNINYNDSKLDNTNRVILITNMLAYVLKQGKFIIFNEHKNELINDDISCHEVEKKKCINNCTRIDKAMVKRLAKNFREGEEAEEAEEAEESEEESKEEAEEESSDSEEESEESKEE